MNLLVLAFLVAAVGDPETEPPPVLLEMPAARSTPESSADPAAPTTTTTTTNTTEPAPTAPTPPTTTTTADPAADVAPRVLPALAEDEAGNAAYTACLGTARVDTPAVLRACFERVATAHPDTLAAVRARANVTLLDAEHDVAEGEATRSWLPPGRLELVGVAGLFGVWNAIAGGVIVASNSNGANPGGLLIGVSAASLALGVGFGIGGAAIGDALQLDEGASRMVASGLVWGTNIGIGLLPVVFDLQRGTTFNVAVPILTVVGAGWVGGLGTLALTNVLKLDTPAVSMVNSGGIWGSVVGGLVMINLASAAVEPSVAYSATYIGGNVVGLVGGALLSQVVDVSWGETLIFDLGAVIGGSVLGLGTTGVLVSIGGDGDPTPIVTSAVGVGVLGGYGLGMLTLAMLRDEERPLLRSFGVTPTTPKPVAVFDSVGQPVVMQTMAFAF